MTLQQLKYFITVAEIGNITDMLQQRLYTSHQRSADRSRCWKRNQGIVCLICHSKPLKLTEPGKILYDGMKEALSQINHTWRQPKQLRKGKAEHYQLHFRQDIIQNICFLRSSMN